MEDEKLTLCTLRSAKTGEECWKPLDVRSARLGVSLQLDYPDTTFWEVIEVGVLNKR